MSWVRDTVHDPRSPTHVPPPCDYRSPLDGHACTKPGGHGGPHFCGSLPPETPMMPCGCDPMVAEDAESCKRCDDEACDPNGCARLQAFRKHCLHAWNPPAPSPSSAVPKSLTDNDVANLAKIAALRGYAGKLRTAIVEARGVLHASRTAMEHEAWRILSRALETPVPEDGT